MTRGGEWQERVRAVQEALLPRAFPSTGIADVEAASYSPGDQLSGDLCDCVHLPDADVYVIGDSTGHGTGSALVGATVFGAIRACLRFTREPCEIFAHVHALLAELGERSGGPRVFSTTLFIGVLGEDGVLSHSNAGHPSPLLLRRGVAVATPLHPTSPPLGLVAPESCRHDRLQMLPGDRLVLYTDGCIPPNADPEDVREEVDRNLALDPDALARHLVSDGTDDDRLAVVVTFRGRRPAAPPSGREP